MSYTFSRRDFMKYSAVAAVAVAGSSMFTGCGSISNPNRPSAVYNAAEDSKLTFGSSNIFTKSSDYHILKKSGTYTEGTGTLSFTFIHHPTTQGTSATPAHYQLKYIDADGVARYINSTDAGITAGGAGLSPNEDTEVKLTATIPADEKVAVKAAKAVYIQYFPRHNALGRENDSYSDVYATWEITSLFKTTT